MQTAKRLNHLILMSLSALILIAWVPGGVVPPGQEGEPSPYQRLEHLPKGVRYDPEQGWYFYGLPYERVRYEMPGGKLDLVHVMFLDQDGVSRQAWVALGLQLSVKAPLRYLSCGSWRSSEEAWQQVQLWETPVKVSISGEGSQEEPRVSLNGVNWAHCREDGCYYAHFFDCVQAPCVSNHFIRTQEAPSWYPWGFLFWDVQLVDPPRSSLSVEELFSSRGRAGKLRPISYLP